MYKAKTIFWSIMVWWVIELLYVGFMLSGFSFWTTIKGDKFSYNLYLIEFIINIILFDFWILLWYYNTQIKFKLKYSYCLFFLFLHCYCGLKVFLIDNVNENLKRRVYAYLSWVAWFILCGYLQISYINPKLYKKNKLSMNIKKSSSVYISRILTNIF